MNKKLQTPHESIRKPTPQSSRLFQDALEMLPKEDDQSAGVNRI
jgi:hypothetical protein